MTALALMDLVDFPGRVRATRLAFAGRDLAHDARPASAARSPGATSR